MSTEGGSKWYATPHNVPGVRMDQLMQSIHSNACVMNRRTDQLSPAHTISQRLRQLKKIPPELLPLGTYMTMALAERKYI